MFGLMVVALILTAVVWWAFCFWYHLISKWWKNPYGRNLMSVGAAVASMYTLLTVYAFVDRWNPVFTFVAVILLLWSLYAAGRRIYLVDRTQRGDD